jgi:hypothetical protein
MSGRLACMQMHAAEAGGTGTLAAQPSARQITGKRKKRKEKGSLSLILLPCIPICRDTLIVSAEAETHLHTVHTC